ncbi:MAG TPA: NlpC/P60 family protein [Bacteroidetes bacterium]|nr:NlpC/P60 family protein [Bacteroidota bacterium]
MTVKWCVALSVCLLLASPGCMLFKDVSSPSAPHTETHASRDKKPRLRSEVTKDARKYLGTRYKYGGKTSTGFDCSGFVSHVLQKNGIPVSGPSYALEKLGKKISKEKARPGDLVFFRKSRTGKVFHVSMVYENDHGDLTLIHSTSSRGVVIDKLSESSYWRSKVMTVRDVISGR